MRQLRTCDASHAGAVTVRQGVVNRKTAAVVADLLTSLYESATIENLEPEGS